MKRLMVVLLLLMLVLSGCGEEPVATTLPTTVPTLPTEPEPGLYMPGSELEQQTGGAVLTYLPDVSGFPEICFMGNTMLLTEEDTKENTTRITALKGQNKTPKNSIVLDTLVSPSKGNLWLGSRELVYHDQQKNRLVWLDESFVQVREVTLPEGAASPVVSGDLRKVYYCLGDEIHVMNTDTGISHLLKQHSCAEQTLLGVHINDTVLQVRTVDNLGGTAVLFVSTQTGETVGADAACTQMRSGGDRYMIRRNDGALDEVVIGSPEYEKSFYPDHDGDLLIPMFGADGLLVAGAEELTLYNAVSGRRVSCVSFPEVATVYGMTLDPDGRHIWMLHNNLQNGQTSIFCWDPEATAVEDDIIYIDTRYTDRNPDEAGLQACAKRAEELSEKYGIRLLIYRDPVAPEGYRFQYEYHVSLTNQALEDIETALAKYPEGFLKMVGQVSQNEVLTVGLVRGVEVPATLADAQEPGVQYFLEKDAWIVLPMGEGLQQAFHHQLMHAMDTFIFNRTNSFDDWEEDMNPWKFTYYNNYKDYLQHPKEDSWLWGTTRYFVDAYSMCSAREDRARILEYAMMEGNEEVFASEGMQKKLRQLGLGIRRACDWQKESTVYPWEQYLKNPLARKK